MAPPAAVPTILVVEDDRALRDFYAAALRSAGYRAATVEDGLDALRWIEQETPAAIVLDLSLIRLSGRDVQRELRARTETRRIPIVVVTGGDTHDLNISEIVCLLAKPVTDEALADAVRRCLGRT